MASGPSIASAPKIVAVGLRPELVPTLRLRMGEVIVVLAPPAERATRKPVQVRIVCGRCLGHRVALDMSQ